MYLSRAGAMAPRPVGVYHATSLKPTDDWHDLVPAFQHQTLRGTKIRQSDKAWGLAPGFFVACNPGEAEGLVPHLDFM